MNISKPVASSLDIVEFRFLSANEIHAISARRIENEQTFDNLNNPIPGGLYDPALGSWSDSYQCATCNLLQAACPGHPGHIDLPIAVYHPVFMDQLYRLLRSQCVYCHTFRLARSEIHHYASILRLLQYGLLQEAQVLDSLAPSDVSDELVELMDPELMGLVSDKKKDESRQEHFTRVRGAYVKQAIRRSKEMGHEVDISKSKHEGLLTMRRDVVKAFLVAIMKPRNCGNCGGISPKYRKDGVVKIFEKELSAKDKASMAMRQKTRASVFAIKKDVNARDGPAGDHEGVNGVDESEEEDEGSGDELDENGNVVRPVQKTSKAKATAPKTATQRYVAPSEVLARLNLLFEREQDMISLLYNNKPLQKTRRVTADMFFLQTILVPPNRYRPEAHANDKIQEAQQNKLYQNIIRSAAKVSQISRQLHNGDEQVAASWAKDMSRLHEACVELQEWVNSLIDSTKNPVRGQAAKRNEDGIKQKLEKKEGLFRKNMMGKRVNYAARSVISPDPNIETNEIGVPPVFASKLTYPEPVTSHNFKVLRQAVINGMEKWPGATAIEMDTGQMVHLGRKSREDRVALANQLLAPTSSTSQSMRNKKVHRHISNGDVVLMNRQPTLHKPSIMGHRVRVLPGERTIRMHYANCNAYNADFDGDEMNMHFPQNEIARAEALQLADTDHQYVSATAGKPLRGLIQDHLSVSVELCSKDSLFDRQTYQQLVYSALRPESGHIRGDRIELVPPAILKPLARWTGKQVITTLLKNIRPADCGDLWMNGKSSVKGDSWGRDSEEGNVVFRDGEFISGILDKSQLGPSSGGLVHSIHEVYGAAIAGKFLSAMGRLLNRLLSMRAFTCGMDDLRLTPKGEAARREKIKASRGLGLQVAVKYVSLQDRHPGNDDPDLLQRLEEVLRDDKKQEGLDLLLTQQCSEVSSSITSTCLPAGLAKAFPKNHMQSMTLSGAKGSQVNANLISCNLGQQVLEGRRVPVMISGKTLPCFKAFDTDLRAGGYIESRFLTGIRPQEYFFHLMAGREGLIDTAVKTSRSGYLQRCIIKGMEGLSISYDSSVRDSDGSICQFLYGEDGIDVTKRQYLNDFEFLLRNNESEIAQIQYANANSRGVFDNKDAVLKQMKNAVKSVRYSIHDTLSPVISELDPAKHTFATSEAFYKAMTEYNKENAHGLIREKKGRVGNSAGPQFARKTVEKLFALKYQRSLVEPGEAVGIVAGQSIGEPSTQMTLNTFHLAGHSARNVTLGIPRLREILMTASATISTPSMTLVLNEELTQADGERFAKAISVLSLADVLDSVSVRERVGKGEVYALAKMYQVRLRFFPASEYSRAYAIGVTDVLETLERKFLTVLEMLIKKAIKAAGKGSDAATPEVGQKSGNREEVAAGTRQEGRAERGDAEDEDDDGEGDDDATANKQRANRSEAVSYGPNDDEDDNIQKSMREEDLSDHDDDEDDDVDATVPTTRVEDEDSHEETKAREDRAKSKNKFVSRYRCDKEGGEWCEFTLEFEASIPKFLMIMTVQDAIRKSLIQQLPGIGRCTFVADEKVQDAQTNQERTAHVVHTEGSNLRAMQQYGDYINPNRVSTNDIAAVLGMYGVEACRTNIVREVASVFTSHGISVDKRHLTLVADHMTRNGGFSPFNRMGLASNISPFTKMSFETTLSFLKEAVLDGDWDALNAPSSRLAVGKLGKIGTGLFDVLVDTPTRYMDAVYPDS